MALYVLLLMRRTAMKTNALMDEIRRTTPPEIKKQVDLCVAIANRIYDILDERGMSQRDLARKLGKTETEVSRWLSGTHNLTIATIAKIAAVLDDDIIKPTSPETGHYQIIEGKPTMVAEPNIL